MNRLHIEVAPVAVVVVVVLVNFAPQNALQWLQAFLLQLPQASLLQYFERRWYHLKVL